MCEAGDGQSDWMDALIIWQGWRTTVRILLANGWEVEWRSICRKSQRGKPLDVIGTRIYLRHTIYGHLARFTSYHDSNRGTFILDFMVHRKQYGRKSIRIEERANAYGPEDVSALLGIIEEIQKKYPKRKKKADRNTIEVPVAEIMRLVA